MQFPPLEAPDDGEEEEESSHNQVKVKVVNEDEWTGTIRHIVQRDFFPIPSSQEINEVKRMRLDEYLATHISEDQAAFSDLLQKEEEAHLATFSNKKDFLRMVGTVETKSPAIKDYCCELSTQSEKKNPIIRSRRIVDPKATRFPSSPHSQQHQPRRRMLKPEERTRTDLDLVSLSSRSTMQSLGRNQKSLSGPGLALVERIRRSQKKKLSSC